MSILLLSKYTRDVYKRQVPGDISWAMRLGEAKEDFNWLAALTGQKLLVRGNHDYWWSAIGNVRKMLPSGIYALQNDCFRWGRWTICGTRGWLCPGDENFDPEHDQKIYLREIHRLRLSLEDVYKRQAYKRSGRFLYSGR